MIRLEDIAKLAGVSKTTASLALNGKPGISHEKRNKILQIAEEYHYKPLRKVKKKSSTEKYHTVRLLVCSDVNRFTYNFQHLPYFNELVNDFLILTRNYPIDLLINSVSLHNLEKEFLALEDTKKSEAIILLGTDLPEISVIAINQLHDNVIVLDTCFKHHNNNFISINNFQGAYIATEFLIRNGHKNIGYVKSKQRIQNFQERKEGFMAALKKYHLATENIPQLIFPANDIKSHPELLRRENHPTAYFCENDSIAISLIKSLQARGMRVPDDISIIGFDNISEAQIISPELTTIDVNRRFMVQKALDKALQIIINGEKNQTQVYINTRLVERQSVKNLLSNEIPPHIY